MSDALIWHLIRDNNSFLVKRGNMNRQGAVKFSKEPGNIMNASSFKWSGLANSKTVDIADAGNDHVKVRVSTKAAGKSQTPKLSNISTTSRTFTGIPANYRNDLAKAASIRFAKVSRGARVKKARLVSKK